MDEIERYLDDVCRTLGGSHDLRQHIRDELRDHIGETIDALAAKGLSLEDAAHKAIEDFGKPEDMRRELQSVYGRQVTAFLIGRAIAWKEQNMKSGWKWSFAATGVLLMLIVGQVLCIYAPFVFIFPGIRWHFEALGEALPALTAASLRAGTLVLGREAIPAWALLVAVLVA